MSIYGAETIATALLILLGDGVVAAVLLNHSKVQNSGRIVITRGWAMGVMLGVFAVAQFSGAHLNSAIFADQATADAGVGGLIVGLLVLGIGLSLGGPTGYAINPARDLVPRVAHFLLPIPGKGTSDWGSAWIPVAGPLIGGAIAALLFKWFYP